MAKNRFVIKFIKICVSSIPVENMFSCFMFVMMYETYQQPHSDHTFEIFTLRGLVFCNLFFFSSRKYQPITFEEERDRYKDDFYADYKEYLDLHREVSARFRLRLAESRLVINDSTGYPLPDKRTTSRLGGSRVNHAFVVFKIDCQKKKL